MIEELDIKYVIFENGNLNDYDLVFCDTDLYYDSDIESYPICFESLYKRNIYKSNIRDVLKTNQQPYFIKPVCDKLFDGFVVKTKWDIEYAKTLDNCEIYVSEVIDFINEYRIFIGNYSVIGISFVKGEIREDYNEFINELLLLNEYKYCIVDIGFSDRWSIVEVNPPFSASYYDLDVKIAFSYFKNVHNYYKQLNS